MGVRLQKAKADFKDDLIASLNAFNDQVSGMRTDFLRNAPFDADAAPAKARALIVTLPSHHRYITVTIPLHHRYITVTLPSHYRHTTVALPSHYRCTTL